MLGLAVQKTYDQVEVLFDLPTSDTTPLLGRILFYKRELEWNFPYFIVYHYSQDKINSRGESHSPLQLSWFFEPSSLCYFSTNHRDNPTLQVSQQTYYIPVSLCAIFSNELGLSMSLLLLVVSPTSRNPTQDLPIYRVPFSVLFQRSFSQKSFSLHIQYGY